MEGNILFLFLRIEEKNLSLSLRDLEEIDRLLEHLCLFLMPWFAGKQAQ